jgi:hypothetical protein
MKKYNFSDHFERFVIKGEELDFDSFRTREDFDRYKEELETFGSASDKEVEEIVKYYIDRSQ